jgi:predicted MFS family arabinose efflux permease
VAGSAWLALRAGVDGLPAVVAAAAAVFGVGIVIFSASPSLWLSLAAMVAVGWGLMAVFVSCNMMLQARTSDAMRGRLMALFSMTFMGLAPVGGLLGGWCADRVGAPLTLGVGGAACVAAGVLYWRRHFRPPARV